MQAIIKLYTSRKSPLHFSIINTCILIRTIINGHTYLLEWFVYKTLLTALNYNLLCVCVWISRCIFDKVLGYRSQQLHALSIT